MWILLVVKSRISERTVDPPRAAKIAAIAL